MLDRESGNTLRLQLKVNGLLISIGILALSFSIISALLKKHTFHYFITHPSIILLLSGLFILTMGQLFGKNLLKYIHIILISTTALVSIHSDYDQFYGIGQMILLLLLLYKYGFLNRYIKCKLLAISLVFIASIELSIRNSELSGIGVEVFMYVAFFLIFLYIIYKDDIDDILASRNLIHSNKMALLEKEKRRIEKQLGKYKARLKEVDQAIEMEVRGEKEIDWDQYNLTKTERKIITILVTRNASNKQIAEELGVKERTIKTHLYNIYNKIGIGTRSELIGMFYSLEEKEKNWEADLTV
jgi:DNA-binding CsgD family transcriptional regulator